MSQFARWTEVICYFPQSEIEMVRLPDYRFALEAVYSSSATIIPSQQMWPYF